MADRVVARAGHADDTLWPTTPNELLNLLESLLDVLCAGPEPEPGGVLVQHARTACQRLRRQLEHLGVIDELGPFARTADRPDPDRVDGPGPVAVGPGALLLAAVDEGREPVLPQGGSVAAAGLVIDVDGCCAVVAGRTVALNRAETLVAAVLVANAWRAVPYDVLQAAGWPGRRSSIDRLRVAVSVLRTKLGLQEFGLVLQAVTGVGYRLAAANVPSGTT